MVTRFLSAISVCSVFFNAWCASAIADDNKAARDRAAKAALALAATKAPDAVAVAPSPRPAVQCYPTGCQAAKDAGKPLVVYIACEAKSVDGAIVAQCSAETFGETQGPAIVVGYPRGDRMFVEATLACDASQADVAKAVKDAAKKTTPPPKQMPPAAAADTWRIGAEMPAITGSQVSVISASTSGGDGLAEVNAKRAARGLRPFAHDSGLAAAAKACAEYRAAHLMFNHTSNDFGFLPKGSTCDATGCAAYPPSYGWLSCATFDDYTRAGAYWAMGRDGKRYMHLYVGYGSPTAAASQTASSGVVTYREVIHPDATGRMARWNVPSDPRRPWIFAGYVDTSTVQPGWELNPFVKPYYAGTYCLPGRA